MSVAKNSPQIGDYWPAEPGAGLRVYLMTLSPGTLSQFLIYAILAASSLGQLSEVWGDVQRAAGASTFRVVERWPADAAPSAT